MYVKLEFGFKSAAEQQAFFASQQLMDKFKEDVQAQLGTTLHDIFSTKFDQGDVHINKLYPGSVVVELSIDTEGVPLDSVKNVVQLLESSGGAGSIFDSNWLSDRGLSSVTATIMDPPSSTTTNIPAIVGGAVGGVGGAALVAGATWYILRRRRAAGVEPRNGGALLGDHEA